MVYDKVIEGLTVRLRSIQESDAEVSFRMRTDPEKTKYLHRINNTVEGQWNYIKKQKELEGDYLFIIEDLERNPIGMKGVYNYDPVARTVKTGRFISYGSQVQNIEALKLSFDFAFEVLCVEKIIMGALENNTVMLGIQKRFGVEFTHHEKLEGIEYDNICSVLEKDTYMISKIKVESLIKRFADRM